MIQVGKALLTLKIFVILVKTYQRLPKKRSVVHLDRLMASGPDGLSPMLLRACHLELSDIFHTIYNESITRGGTIPVLWKRASIIPVPKSLTQ